MYRNATIRSLNWNEWKKNQPCFISIVSSGKKYDGTLFVTYYDVSLDVIFYCALKQAMMMNV